MAPRGGTQAPAGQVGVGARAASFPEKSVLSQLQLKLEKRLLAASACTKSVEQGAKKQRKAEAGARKAAKQSSPAPRVAGADKLEYKDKHRGTQQTIMAYLETCLFLDKPDWAQQCLIFCYHSRKYRKLLCSKMYNILLRGWAKKGSLKQVSGIFFMLHNAGLKPTVESYAMALECMGRVSCAPKKIRQCMKQLEKDGFHLNDLFQHVTYEDDGQDMVLAALRVIQPKYQLPPPPQAEAYTKPVLRDFYSKKLAGLYPKLDFSVEELQELFQKQLDMEMTSTVTIPSLNIIGSLSQRSVKAQKHLASLCSQWQQSLLQGLQESRQHQAKNMKKAGPKALYPYLCLLKDKEYVEIMLQTLMNLPPQGEMLSIVAKELGSKVYIKYMLQKKVCSQVLDKVQRVYKDYVHLLARDTQPDSYLPREYWEKLEASTSPLLMKRDSDWPEAVRLAVGICLLELMVQVLKVQSNLLNCNREWKLIPVLYHVYSFSTNHRIGLIKPHPIFSHVVVDAAKPVLTFSTSQMPMLCPPIPWISPSFGTYILSPTKLMRSTDGAIQHQILLDECPSATLHPVLDALNYLGNCPWKINQPVLDIVISIFNDKGSEKLDIPPPLSEAPKPSKQTSVKMGSLESKAAMRQELAQCRKKAAEMYSLRMDALYMLSIANYLRDQVFWLPHNMDFRGRTYPCPPYLNHLRNDVARGILLFAKGKPLGPHGFDWLRIHLVNLTGLKKNKSLQDRLAYAKEIMEDILDSADHPLTGRKWWMGTDEPWQVLACCMEIARASRVPDPAAYISHFPIHQDGSCNGLQHYAALGRDLIGATSVNLMPCDEPQDVYTTVAKQVEELRRQDAEEGVHVAQLLEGFIKRKLVKQTVMTVVYGVTRYGSRLQMEKQLKDNDGFPEEFLWAASHYLVQKAFFILQQMFSRTREIQAWLTDSARLISQSGRTVEWVTPLGLPIVQPYHQTRRASVQSAMQVVTVKMQFDNSQKPNTMKQKNAFPPNFIHSLDSTHMMLTALHCCRQGLTFVSVHDCYWTHACSVDIMNQMCREQFVELHSQPILQDLAQFMLQKYCTVNSPMCKKSMMLEEILSKIPETGDLDLEKVKESTYFFS
ncbi:PREDICTED: DNA-directed RNA polymerase, mitochondrial [Gavialis gangeticus]|uniref:DNA-directed RNA polymerase, mitochondrial n=1 Tax=Gavialis gangeticus TaxID=94835 RepID=UPI00092EDCD5|nr:PREDICTED: DNA-directed RNA polymerase, mitochondrial [Gavialis gangeticus]